MLYELRVKNLGIIEDITWQLGEGLNVITGETGAGKSLIIDAIEFLLSGKADEQAIRFGANEAQIEGVFNLPASSAYNAVRDFLTGQELSEDDETLVISVRLRRQSPGVIRVNGRAVSKGVLRQIGRLLIDIHGQSEHLSLLDTKYHLNFLDSFGRILDLKKHFAVKASELRGIEQELSELQKNEQDRGNRAEFLKFQIAEIGRAELREGEDEDLEKELNILSSAEKVKELSYEAYRALYEEEGTRGSLPALDRLNEAVESMKKLVELDPALKPQLQIIEDAVCSVTEAAREIHAYGDRMHFEPARFEEIESRLELIRDLKRKFGKAISDILNFQAKASAELDALTNYTDRLAGMAKSRSALKKELGQMAFHLSQERTAAARRLEAEVRNELNDLNMTQVEFGVSITQKPDIEGINFPSGSGSSSAVTEPDTETIEVCRSVSNLYSFSDDGADSVEFIVSTNPGEPARPLNKIASTGELSRFTLALKSALAGTDSIPVLIFDEIDIGIGGRNGDIIGKKLWLLGRTHQVICVTHLPQIAAFADSHFGVRKIASGERTLSVLETFAGDSRVRELAAMLSGSQFTETALKNARELKSTADGWKEKQTEPKRLI